MADHPSDEQADIDGLWYPANPTIQFIWIGVGLQGVSGFVAPWNSEQSKASSVSFLYASSNPRVHCHRLRQFRSSIYFKASTVVWLSFCLLQSGLLFASLLATPPFKDALLQGFHIRMSGCILFKRRAAVIDGRLGAHASKPRHIGTHNKVS
jgi:hypothetical protein